MAVGVIGGRFFCSSSCAAWRCPARASTRSERWPVCLMLYGIATLAHGSGFLAVFAAGIMIGDAHAPYKPEIKRFHAALAGLAEIVAFAVAGVDRRPPRYRPSRGVDSRTHSRRLS